MAAARVKGNLLGKNYGSKTRITTQTQDNTIHAQDKVVKKYESFSKSENRLSTEIDEEKTQSKRINMAFSDKIYNMLLQESSSLGTGISFYINELIRTTKSDDVADFYDRLLIKPNRNNISRRKGAAAKRITVKFDPDIHKKIVNESEHYNQTITQFVNMIIDLNTK